MLKKKFKGKIEFWYKKKGRKRVHRILKLRNAEETRKTIKAILEMHKTTPILRLRVSFDSGWLY